MKQLFLKYKALILYVFFGGCTTVVDWGFSFLLYHMNVNVHLADGIAWLCAVIFAFVTNKLWVFESKTTGQKQVQELGKFMGARLTTLILQELILVLLVDCLSFNEYVCKIVASVFVTVGNYFISKYFVFHHK